MDTSLVSTAAGNGVQRGTEAPVLSAVGIEKAYRRLGRGRARVLAGAGLELYPGEVVGLVGRTARARAR